MTLTDQEQHWLFDTLKKVEFLSFCSIGEVEELALKIIKKNFKKGETIIRQGEKGDFLFLIYRGEVSVRTKTGWFGSQEIARMGPGNYLGEMALVSFEPRSATVTTLKDTDAFLLFSSDFRALLNNNEQLFHNIDEIIARRKADKELELGRKGAGESSKFWSGLKRLIGMS